MSVQRVAVPLLAATLLCACSAGAPTSTPSGGSTTRAAASLSGRDVGLQLRPVLEVQPANAAQCTSASGAPPSTAPVTACASDGSLVYSLGPAVVTGTQWDTLRVDDVSVPGTTQIDALLDPSGSSALTQATGELFSNDEPRNQLAVYAEGVVLSAPTVQQPIYGGALVIAGGLTNDEAQALLDRLTSA